MLPYISEANDNFFNVYITFYIKCVIESKR